MHRRRPLGDFTGRTTGLETRNTPHRLDDQDAVAGASPAVTVDRPDAPQGRPDSLTSAAD